MRSMLLNAAAVAGQEAVRKCPSQTRQERQMPLPILHRYLAVGHSQPAAVRRGVHPKDCPPHPQERHPISLRPVHCRPGQKSLSGPALRDLEERPTRAREPMRWTRENRLMGASPARQGSSPMVRRRMTPVRPMRDQEGQRDLEQASC